jgi:hypothetical protein
MLFEYWRKSPPSHILQRMRYEYQAPVDMEERLKEPPSEMEHRVLSSLPGKSLDNEPLYRQDAIHRALEDFKKRTGGKKNAR